MGSCGLVSGVDFEVKVDLELDLKELRIWVKSCRRAESLSRSGVTRQTTAGRESPARGSGWSRREMPLYS